MSTGQSKALASLSSTLLARKGTAKPAMRPQGFGGFGALSSSGLGGGHDVEDDLGWNDMGVDPMPTPTPALVPPVLVQREVLREEFAAPPVIVPPVIVPAPTPVSVISEAPRAVSIATATRIGRDTGKQHNKRHPKSAFTLRLDQERHLRLRLASALQNASAQTLVTQALDQFLQSLPEVDELVRQLPPRAIR